MRIQTNRSELMQRMGSMTTEREAVAMTLLLKKRGIETFEDLDNQLDDKEFFELIPEATVDRLCQCTWEDGDNPRCPYHHPLISACEWLRQQGVFLDAGDL
jgi:hypothetical protein